MMLLIDLFCYEYTTIDLLSTCRGVFHLITSLLRESVLVVFPQLRFVLNWVVVNIRNITFDHREHITALG